MFKLWRNYSVSNAARRFLSNTPGTPPARQMSRPSRGPAWRWIFLLFTLLSYHIHAYKPIFPTLCPPKYFSTRLYAEDGVSLMGLVDVDIDSYWLGDAVCNWLDKEYIPLEIHRKIGDRVSVVYSSGREEGVSDLGELLMRVGSSFEDFNMRDAFIGPWDVANKVSDLLMVRMNRELCSCSPDSQYNTEESKDAGLITVAEVEAFDETVSIGTEITQDDSTAEYQENTSLFTRPSVLTIESINSLTISSRARVADTIPVTPSIVNGPSVIQASKKYADEFSRYKLLKEFVDGELQWSYIQPIIALCIGFRASEIDQTLTQVDSLAPPGWKYLKCLPDFSNLNDVRVEKKLLSELPEDEGATDIVMEQLVGQEMYKMMNANEGDIEGKRRLLVGKWLYVRGVFHDVFPHKELFIPGHMRDDLEGNEDEENK